MATRPLTLEEQYARKREEMDRQPSMAELALAGVPIGNKYYDVKPGKIGFSMTRKADPAAQLSQRPQTSQAQVFEAGADGNIIDFTGTRTSLNGSGVRAPNPERGVSPQDAMAILRGQRPVAEAAPFTPEQQRAASLITGRRSITPEAIATNRADFMQESQANMGLGSVEARQARLAALRGPTAKPGMSEFEEKRALLKDELDSLERRAEGGFKSAAEIAKETRESEERRAAGVAKSALDVKDAEGRLAREKAEREGLIVGTPEYDIRVATDTENSIKVKLAEANAKGDNESAQIYEKAYADSVFTKIAAINDDKGIDPRAKLGAIQREMDELKKFIGGDPAQGQGVDQSSGAEAAAPQDELAMFDSDNSGTLSEEESIQRDNYNRAVWLAHKATEDGDSATALELHEWYIKPFRDKVKGR